MAQLTRSLSIALGALAVASLTACVAVPYDARPAPYPVAYPAPVAQPAPYYQQQQPRPSHMEYGRISNIEVMQSEQARAPSGAGALLGGVLGAVVGNQIGHGGGRALATGIGAVGGAVAGNQIEGNQRGPIVQTYRVSVQLDNGSGRAFDVPSPGDLRIGDRVRIQDGQIQRF
ncbi:glycine zipper 2TM domain-containing protein [Xylophilus sp. GW821-FHT01B05]